MSTRLQVQLAPQWDAVKVTWDRCLAHLRAGGLDEDVAYSLSMAAQELLENAVKYGVFSDPSSGIELGVEVAAREVTIEVKSPAEPHDDGRLKKLDQTIQWIRGFQNPFEAYVEKLKEVSAQEYRPDQSGLGLTRVAYEAHCILDFYVDEKDIVAVSAVYHR